MLRQENRSFWCSLVGRGPPGLTPEAATDTQGASGLNRRHQGSVCCAPAPAPRPAPRARAPRARPGRGGGPGRACLSQKGRRRGARRRRRRRRRLRRRRRKRRRRPLFSFGRVFSGGWGGVDPARAPQGSPPDPPGLSPRVSAPRGGRFPADTEASPVLFFFCFSLLFCFLFLFFSFFFSFFFFSFVFFCFSLLFPLPSAVSCVFGEWGLGSGGPKPPDPPGGFRPRAVPPRGKRFPADTEASSPHPGAV